MNALDWAIVAVVLLSTLLGLWRGFVREALSLAGWIVGIWLALRFAQPLGAGLPFELPWRELRTALAAVVIVLATIIGFALLAWVVGRLLRAVRLGAVDRVFGGIFGLARALLVLAVFIVVGRRTELAHAGLWTESSLIPQVEAAVRFAAPHLPVQIADLLRL